MKKKLIHVPISLLARIITRFLGGAGLESICIVLLLALAVAHGGRLVSFDQRIDPQQVPDATAALSTRFKRRQRHQIVE
jgi:hypothetical protein